MCRADGPQLLINANLTKRGTMRHYVPSDVMRCSRAYTISLMKLFFPKIKPVLTKYQI